ncbi:uncharacterized protein LOC111640708 [Centruroides sculpturatus]|uniref:uncharacterized protein LOC111640708 n=1 Tax=Centruroides sculpturatus TaxID=218467 RepID=UPI000C6E2C79|nr:uncharacterized protein LOC111640708 [Centruroides sculpturatus]
MVAVELRLPGGTMVVVSSYRPPSLKLGVLLTELEKVVSPHKWVVLAGDFNAKHSLWGSPVDDLDGDTMKEAAEGWGMHVLNDPFGIATYSSPSGESWIDLTIVSGAMLKLISQWETIDSESCSDHRFIAYHVMCDSPEWQSSCYRLNDGNRSQFAKCLKHKTVDIVTQVSKVESVEDLKDVVATLTEAVREAGDCTLAQRRPVSHRSVPWWNQELSVLRKRVRAL